MNSKGILQDDLSKVLGKSRIPAGSSPQGVPFWGEDPESWDHVVIQRVKLPGICELRGHGFKQRVDRKKVPGKNGATFTHLGVEAAEFDIVLTLWTEEHLQKFAKLIPTLKPRKKKQKTVDRYKLAGADTPGLQAGSVVGIDQGTLGEADASGFQALTKSLAAKQKKTVTDGGPEAVSIYHPALALYQIRACLILEASLPEKGQGKDLFTIRLKCVEAVFGAARNGVVSTKKKSKDLELTNLEPGGGAVSKKLQRPTPADDNTGPR